MPIVKLLDSGSAGIIKDAPAWSMPDQAWSDGSNVQFKDGILGLVPGYASSFGTPSGVPYGLFPALDGSGNRYIVYPSLTAIYAVTGTTQYTITRLAGGNYGATADTKWTGGLLSGIVVVNAGSGSDDPQFWVPQGGGNMAALSNWPASTKCRVMRPFQQYLIAFDVTKGSTRYPYMVKWSAQAASGSLPASWDETDATKDAGEYDLSEGQDFIVDALQLGSQLVIYREQSAYLMRWIGGNEIFAFQRVPNSTGMLANNCAVNIPLGHVILTQGDAVLFNGQDETSILDGRMKRYLQSTIDSGYKGRAFVASNPVDSEVYLCFPTSGSTSCNRAIVWSWKNNTLSLRDIPNATCGATTPIAVTTPEVWSSDSGAWSADTTTWDSDVYSLVNHRMVLGTTASKLHVWNVGTTADGTPFVASVERTGISLGDGQTVKQIHGVYPKVEGSAGATIGIQVGASMAPDEGYTWSAEQTYTIGSSRKVDTRLSGRYLGLRIRSTSSAFWRMPSADIDIRMAGGR